MRSSRRCLRLRPRLWRRWLRRLRRRTVKRQLPRLLPPLRRHRSESLQRVRLHRARWCGLSCRARPLQRLPRFRRRRSSCCRPRRSLRRSITRALRGTARAVRQQQRPVPTGSAVAVAGEGLAEEGVRVQEEAWAQALARVRAWARARVRVRVRLQVAPVRVRLPAHQRLPARWARSLCALQLARCGRTRRSQSGPIMTTACS